MAPITRNLTILLTDIKGFTDKTSHKSRAEIQQMLERHKQLVLPVLQAKGGALVKTIGDAFLMTFESPTDAVLAGVEVQETLRRFNADKAHEDRIEIRIAINQGEVNLADNDVFGEPVNITARIEAIAEAGEVFFTDAVYLAMNKKEVPSSEVGLLQLKGIPEKVRVYKVRREIPVEEPEAEPAAPARRIWQAINPLGAAGAPAAGPARSKPSWVRRLAAITLDAALCGLIIGFFWHDKSHESRRHKVRVVRHSTSAATPSKESVSFGREGLTVDGPDARVHVGPDGVQVIDRGKHPGEDEEGKSSKGPVKVESENDKTAAAEEDESSEEQSDRGGLWEVRRYRFALVWFLYSLIFLRRLGTTPGGKICKLAVVPVSGGAIDRRQNLTRAFFSLISGYCLMLGYFWALWEKDGRGWHDLMAGTRVVAAE